LQDRWKTFPILEVWTFAKAAKGGYLDVLKWAREDQCPWDLDTLAYAARGGYFDMLKQARENGAS